MVVAGFFRYGLYHSIYGIKFVFKPPNAKWAPDDAEFPFVTATNKIIIASDTNFCMPVSLKAM